MHLSKVLQQKRASDATMRKMKEKRVIGLTRFIEPKALAASPLPSQKPFFVLVLVLSASGTRTRPRSICFEYEYEYHFIEYEYDKKPNQCDPLLPRPIHLLSPEGTA